MGRRLKTVREETSIPPDESSIIEDLPERDAPMRRKPTGPKPGKETPGGWRR